MTKREIILQLAKDSKSLSLKQAIEDSSATIEQVADSCRILEIIVEEVLSDSAMDILYHNIVGKARNEISKCLLAFKQSLPDEFEEVILYAYLKKEEEK